MRKVTQQNVHLMIYTVPGISVPFREYILASRLLRLTWMRPALRPRLFRHIVGRAAVKQLIIAETYSYLHFLLLLLHVYIR